MAHGRTKPNLQVLIRDSWCVIDRGAHTFFSLVLIMCTLSPPNSLYHYQSNQVKRLENGVDQDNLQCITSSKDSEKLERSLCLRDKAEDLCWMPEVFGPSDDTASFIGFILSLTLLNGPGNTSRNLPCHLQMSTKCSIMQKGSHMRTWSRSTVVSCGPRLI